MTQNFSTMFPIQDSISICLVVLVLVLFVPVLCKRIRFPQIAGLIVAGLIAGPGLCGILQQTDVLDFFSHIGLLFIMFFAGLEIDLEEMKRNRVWGAVFGILTFALPWTLCYLACTMILGLPHPFASVMGCIMGSHTLVSYPVISRYGLGRRQSVTISVSGALVAILLALIIYAVGNPAGGSEGHGLVLLLIETALYIAAVIFFYPRIALLYFHSVTNSFSHFLFIMIMLALSCTAASMIGLDAIIGAFLAGIVLNRYIPKSSPLMNRLDFVGNTLFVPVFLLNTGMMINLPAALQSWDVIYIFLALFLAGTAAKWLVALLVQKANRYSRSDRLIVFGLSSSHAAGALAIAMGAYSAGTISDNALSATVLIVLFTCILSNVITEKGAQNLHQNTQSDEPAATGRQLVMLTGSNTLQALMDTTLTLRHRDDAQTVGLYVTISGEHAPKYMQDGRGRLEEAARIAASADIPFTTQNRLGNNIIDSIVHAVNEFEAGTLVMGLPLRHSIDLPYFESLIHPLTDRIHSQIILQRMAIPMNTIRRTAVLVPGPVIQDDAFEKSMESVFSISMAIGCAFEFYGKEQAIAAVRGTGLNFSSGRVTYNEVSETADMHWVISGLHSDHLLIIIGTRESESHASRAFLHLYERIHMPETEFSTMLIFPPAHTLKGSTDQSVRTERDFLKMLRM